MDESNEENELNGPWKFVEHCGFIGYGIVEPIMSDEMGLISRQVGERMVADHNACLGIDPAAAIQAARDALGAFASVFEGDLEAVGGGTLTKPELTIQMFKDAKLALKLLTPSKQ